MSILVQGILGQSFAHLYANIYFEIYSVTNFKLKAFWKSNKMRMVRAYRIETPKQIALVFLEVTQPELQMIDITEYW